MRGVTRRAAVAAGAAVVVLGAGAVPAAAGPRPAALAFRPAPFDYGQVAVGQRSARAFTLANTGGRASGAVTVRLSGPRAFRITGDTCRGSLAPGKACMVRVRFAPARAGAVAATLRVVSKNGAAVASDALAGTGTGLGSSGHIYWADRGSGIGTGSIEAAPLTGGIPHAVVTGQTTPWGVAVDSTNIYWANQGNGAGKGTIFAVPLTGGTETPLVTGQDFPTGVAVDAGHIYWANGLKGTINEANLPNGSNPHTLVSRQDAPTGVAVDAGHIYWANQGNDTIMEAPLTGGAATILVSGQDAPTGVAVDAGHIYWANSGPVAEGTINQADLPDGNDPHALPSGTGQFSPQGVAVDSSNIYWADQDAGTINEVPLAGGTVTQLATGQIQPAGVAVGP